MFKLAMVVFSAHGLLSDGFLHDETGYYWFGLKEMFYNFTHLILNPLPSIVFPSGISLRANYNKRNNDNYYYNCNNSKSLSPVWLLFYIILSYAYMDKD